MLTVRGLRGEELEVWTLDYETYYDTKRKFGLKHMTTTQYVRHPDFYVSMLAAVSPTGVSYVLHPDEIRYFLNSIDWTRTAMLAHNTYFDGFIASDLYGVIPAYYLDTLGMSLGQWGLGVRHRLEDVCQRLGIKGKIKGILETTDGIKYLPPDLFEAMREYAAVDAEQCREAFTILAKSEDEGGYDYPKGELDVIDTTIRTFCRPLLEVDAALCRAEIEEEAAQLERLYNLIDMDLDGLSPTCKEKFRATGLDGVLGSSPCFAELLKLAGVAPPMKPSPTHPDKLTYAFGKTDLGLQMLQNDPRVSALVDARIGVKSTIRRTRAERFLIDTNDGTKPLPVPLKYCGARTHRWSGMGSINLQNLPSGKKGTSNRLRQSIRAPKGYRIVVVDSSQIECRFNAFVWGQTDLVELFARNGDPYSELASELYGMPVGKKGPNQHLRPVGKAMELGLGYGMADKKFHISCITGAVIGEPVNISEQESADAVSLYRSKRSRIVAGWSELNKALVHMTHGKGLETDETQLVRNEYGDYVLGPWEFRHNAVLMPNGLFLYYPKLQYRNFIVGRDENGEPITRLQLSYMHGAETIPIWGSKLDENLIQSTTRSIMAERAIEIAKEFPVCLLVHDEVVFLAKESEADEALQFGLDTLCVAPSWCQGLPLAAEGGHSERYDVK